MQKYLILIIFIFSVLILKAQEPIQGNRCTTVDYNESQYQVNPELRFRHEAIKKRIQSMLSTKSVDTAGIIRIPVVVHVIWNTPEQNIPDLQIWSQINVLNEDFRRLNADTVNTPAMFKPFAADSKIEFCMARRTPDSLATYGIERRQTDTVIFPMDNSMKFFASGGLDAWDARQYLNLWVCNMSGNILGYAQYPGGNDSTDGVVIHYYNFGRVGNLDPHYKAGRTATHEIGHWLDLYHIWGDDFGSCDGTDYVDDTPNAKDANYYCPNQPRITICDSTGEMFQNYMDYTDDVCMNIFTHGQRDRMWAAINASRSSLLTSMGCDPVIGIEEHENIQHIVVFPNPGKGIFNIKIDLKEPEKLSLRLNDMLGALVYHMALPTEKVASIKIDLSTVPAGIYFLHLTGERTNYATKLILTH